MSGKILATNKKAYHDFQIEEVVEAGIVLVGAEVKSLRAGRANLKDGYAVIKNNEIFLYNVHISPYAFTTQDVPDPLRVRKLLLNKREIRRLINKVREKGFALLPLKTYLNKRGMVKVELGLGKGKKLYDKRHTLKKKESDREIERAVKKYRE
ncbi:MAG: SsrA-binding protein [Deltaproteobacteria bacterium CG_4_10_14_3_um_filter_60_8]|nr:MAG: SsrA-binding protein [Deltaproteobacteria bacterium CG_4_10_14_3_um_filter_60_8]